MTGITLITEESTLRKLQADLENVINTRSTDRKSVDLRNVEFLYDDNVPVNQMFFMRRQDFLDGRHRLVLHPTLTELVEKMLASLSEAS